MLTVMTNEIEMNNITVDTCTFAVPPSTKSLPRVPHDDLLTDMDDRLLANPPLTQEIIAFPGMGRLDESLPLRTLKKINNGLKKLVADNPEIFEGAIATLPLGHSEQAEKVLMEEIASSDSLLGGQIPSMYHHDLLSSARFESLFKTASDISRPLWMIDADADQICEVLLNCIRQDYFVRYPHLIVIAHGVFASDKVLSLFESIQQNHLTHVYCDTALMDPRLLTTVVSTYGADNILFSSHLPLAHLSASDDPYDMLPHAIRQVKNCVSQDTEVASILSDNWNHLMSHLPVHVPDEK